MQHTANKMLFIINPAAGKRIGRSFADDLTRLFKRGGMQVTTFSTLEQGHARRIVEEIGGDYDLVVCAGGDGTLHEVAEGLMALEKPPRLGYIPAGTLNDVAHSLGLPTAALEAGRVVLEGTPHPLDIGSFQDQHFVYIACFGLFSEVPYLTPQGRKNLLGRLAYFLDGAKRLWHVPTYDVRIEHDGGVLQEELIFCSISNTQRFAGGIVRFLTPGTLLDDGLFEMLLIKKPRDFLSLVRVFFQVRAQRYDPRDCCLLRTSKALFSCHQPIQWTLDGENGGLHAQVRIENQRRRLDIIA
jgi:YegS/Rv2252/BmrU family lipid kinase